MHDSEVHVPSETLARLIDRLSAEIQRLTREIPLREGRLLELEHQVELNADALRRVAAEIAAAREKLALAETDLVALEVVHRRRNAHAA